MKFKNPLLIVTNMDKSVDFYKKVLGLHVVMDFGANKTLTGGLALQNRPWKHGKSLLVKVKFLLGQTIAKFILKRMILTDLPKNSRNCQ